MMITTTMRLFRVVTKNGYTVIVLSDNIEVLECTNFEKCRAMGITVCPPFCERIAEFKKFLRFGKCKFKVEEVKSI